MNRKIFAGDRYENVATGAVVQVTAHSTTSRVEVATVNAAGALVNKRTIGANDLHEDAKTKQGNPRKSGYVRIDALVAAKKKEERIIDADQDIDYDQLDTGQLVKFIAQREAQAKLLKEQAEAAKTVLRARVTERGTRVYGDIAVNAAANSKFDPKLALRNLTPEQYRSICVLKPDGTQAKKLLGEESAAYQSTLAKGDWRLTVRLATDEDREAELMAQKAHDVATFVPGSTLNEDGEVPFG
jgi:hypothetical protein